MPENGQARMIAMLATLSDIQSRRRAQDLAEAQFEESKHQFATSMGFNEKSAEYKHFSDLVDLSARSASEAQSAIVEMAKALHMPSDLVASFMHYSAAHPEALDQTKTKLTQEGINSLTPDARTRLAQESASQTMSGMNTGQASTSALIAALAGNGDPTAAYGKDMLKSMLPGFLQRAATGQTVDQAAVSANFASRPDLVAQAAGIQGGNVTPQQAVTNPIMQSQADAAVAGAQAQLGQVQHAFYATNAQIIANSQEIAAKLATAKAIGGGALTPQDHIAAVNAIRELEVAGGKEKSSSNRDVLTAMRNDLVKLLGYDPSTGEGAKTFQNVITQPSWLQRMSPAQPGLPGLPPGMTPPPPPGASSLPYMNSPQPQMVMPPMFQNPSNPFMRP